MHAAKLLRPKMKHRLIGDRFYSQANPRVLANKNSEKLEERHPSLSSFATQ